MKRSMYFSPPTNCFYEDVLSNTFTQSRLRLCGKVFGLFSLSFKLFKVVSSLNSQIFFVPLLLSWAKVIFHEIKNNNKKVTKRDQKLKRNKNRIIFLFYNKVKKLYLIIKFRKLWITHA